MNDQGRFGGSPEGPEIRLPKLNLPLIRNVLIALAVLIVALTSFYTVEPEEVALQVLEAIDQERFLILTDPIAQKWMEGKTGDPERWLAGMRRVQARLKG